MTDDFPNRMSEKQLEQYLDGSLSERERIDFERLANKRTDVTGIISLQNQIDKQLRSAFAPPSVSAKEIERLVAEYQTTAQAQSKPSRRTTSLRDRRQPPSSSPNRSPVLATIAAAVAVALAISVWTLNKPQRIAPHFEARPLATVYREMVDQGFRPYYFCEDPERFAMTFAKRSGSSQK